MAAAAAAAVADPAGEGVDPKRAAEVARAFADEDASVLARPVATLEDKWKLLPAFLAVRAGPSGRRLVVTAAHL